MLVVPSLFVFLSKIYFLILNYVCLILNICVLCEYVHMSARICVGQKRASHPCGFELLNVSAGNWTQVLDKSSTFS